MPRHPAILVALSLVAHPASPNVGRAQSLPELLHPVALPPLSVSPVLTETRSAADPGGAALGAIVGGAIGMLVIGHAAYYLGGGGRFCGDDPCGLYAGLLGLLAGEAIGIGIGAHVGNRGRGDPLAGVAGSLGVLLLAGMAGSFVDLGDAWIVAIPLGQIAGAVWAETASANARARR